MVFSFHWLVVVMITTLYVVDPCGIFVHIHLVVCFTVELLCSLGSVHSKFCPTMLSADHTVQWLCVMRPVQSNSVGSGKSDAITAILMISISCLYDTKKTSFRGLILLNQNDVYILNSLPLVLYICISESVQHWFRWWLVAFSASSHCLNQC